MPNKKRSLIHLLRVSTVRRNPNQPWTYYVEFLERDRRIRLGGFRSLQAARAAYRRWKG
jgi:hypothetical protein